ncbi:hypothetical protein GCM10025867_23080 [Frondihabitans sucicola]|uniref:VOC domain-containing protein n=1 Tax=Frondihabitans sucicola TaxID=1268041 RepID=A0ABM8GPA6_9MICO|nr:hypothetical protein [Frondihabitans sucicola]BDZ50067.1 hypothetical protein GCM10025867_23080 [Frondihabitans sucicola]
MRITRVVLDTSSLEEAAAYYSGVLELPVDRTDRIVSIRLGDGLLEFVEGEKGAAGAHHLAFLVAADAFDDATRWLRQRVPLLSLDGTDEFEGSAAWNSQSVYFDGPDGSILELIARRELASQPRAARAFSAADILGVSEVGVAVAGLPVVAGRLADAGVPPFRDTSETFAPTGGADGMLILVAPGRAWFPTTDRVAAERPITVYATGGMVGRHSLGEHAELVIEA